MTTNPEPDEKEVVEEVAEEEIVGKKGKKGKKGKEGKKGKKLQEG